jgi:hypothetical protein
MNNTYIYMGTEGRNIYVYMKGKYTKNPLKEYNNKMSEVENGLLYNEMNLLLHGGYIIYADMPPESSWWGDGLGGM